MKTATWKELERHPLSAEYRDITGKAWERFLCKFKLGFNKAFPIYLHEGKVIDGWQRLRACLELGIEPIFTDLQSAA